MADGQHATARVAVRGGVAGELFELVTGEREAVRAETARGGVEQVLLRLDEPARQAPPAGERRGVAAYQEGAQLGVTHREDHEVDGDGEEVSTHP